MMTLRIILVGSLSALGITASTNEALLSSSSNWMPLPAAQPTLAKLESVGRIAPFGSSHSRAKLPNSTLDHEEAQCSAKSSATKVRRCSASPKIGTLYCSAHADKAQECSAFAGDANSKRAECSVRKDYMCSVFVGSTTATSSGESFCSAKRTIAGNKSMRCSVIQAWGIDYCSVLSENGTHANRCSALHPVVGPPTGSVDCSVLSPRDGASKGACSADTSALEFRCSADGTEARCSVFNKSVGQCTTTSYYSFPGACSVMGSRGSCSVFGPGGTSTTTTCARY